MWVELTGNPIAEAMITVIAADSATQKARARSSLVICSPTMRISLGPKSIKPAEIPSAPTSITQNGTPTLWDTPPEDTASTMAASGPTALATSFAPWAKDSSAAEQTKGMVNRVLTALRRFSMRTDA